MSLPAGAEREEADSASAHAPRRNHCTARNATARLTRASNYVFAGFRRAMDRTVDRMGCSCGRQRTTRDEKRRNERKRETQPDAYAPRHVLLRETNVRR